MVEDLEEQQNEKDKNCQFYGEPDKSFMILSVSSSMPKTDKWLIIRIRKQA